MDSIDPVMLGERLAQARKAAGFTQQQVADALGVARTTITAMEAGQRRPRASELSQLARLYGRRVGELVRPPESPQLEAFAVQFRAARRPPGLDDDTDLEADIRLFEQLCLNYLKLERLTNSPLPRRYPPEYEVAGIDVEVAAQEIAESERNRLGLGDGPLNDLWGLLESDVGLRIFAPPFKSSRLSGLFTYTEELGGCIAVNGNHPEERRRWSAAHEYGHFLTDRYRAEITALQQYARLPASERLADAFARHFLMPESGLVRRANDLIRAHERKQMTVADIVTLSHRYAVSFQAMIFRLQDLKLIPASTWDWLQTEAFRPREALAHLGLEPPEPRLTTLPHRYRLLAIQAFEADKLTESELAQMLHVDILGAREEVTSFHADTVLFDTESYGEFGWEQMTLDLGAELTAAR